MKIKDEAEWQQFMQALEEDPDPKAKAFRQFVLDWAELAENQIEEWGKQVPWKDDLSDRPIKALRDNLREVEKGSGRFPVGYIGMALVVFTTHWGEVEEIDAFVDSMTPIEQSLYADVASMKLLEMEMAAKAEGEDEFEFPAELTPEQMADLLRDKTEKVTDDGEVQPGDAG